MIEKGTRFGSWSYDRFLFAGASGTVGLVHRTAAPFTIAVVKIHDGPKTTASRDEFLRERKFVEDQPLAGFMPEWYESGETADGTPWFVMQYAPRLPKKLGRKELKRVIDRVAAALQRLHRLGRLHCDVKRENIGLADGIAVLLDFGSLHRIAAARQHPERVGTWPNMAPEVRDALLLDIRADVYSLGCTFKGLCHRRDRRFFESLIVRATDNDPEKRPQTMAAFRRALVLGQDRLEKAALHARLFWRSAAVVFLCVAIFCGYLALHRSNARKASTQSQVLSRLGELSYENGRYAEAALYLRHALATGACTNAAALYHLAELYRDGLGVEQNLGKYRQLAEKAALLDSPEAKKLLTNLDALRSKRRRNPPANVENITDMRCSGSCKSEDM